MSGQRVLRFFAHPVTRSLLFVTASTALVLGGYSIRLWREVDARLRQGVFASTSNVYAAPRHLFLGEQITPDAVAAELRKSGYNESPENRAGYFRVHADSLEIQPGPDSQLRQQPAVIEFKKNQITSIKDLRGHRDCESYLLEPQLLTNFDGETRDKRRLVRYADVPKVLVDALLAAEDKNFFHHSGFDFARIAKAAYINLRTGRKEQGGSTLTMQLARNIWLEPEKTWKRKAREFVITLMLEDRLSKQQILEHYCNQVYLGSHDTYSIRGFGEAARRYFDKDVVRLTLPEAATLAGIIQRPSVFDPVRHPDAALARRNAILTLMRRNGVITQQQRDSACASPLGIHPPTADVRGAPYFLALAVDEVQSRLGESAVSGAAYRVYTTLDQDLQQAAVEAVAAGLKEVDRLVAHKHPGETARPQVALIALDPQTGEIKAAVGGRNYRASQLNHLLSKRQPGSAFKPFVYAAAMETQLDPKGKHFTGATVLLDQPTTFKFGNEIYEPANFGQQYSGFVTVRRALARSLNVPTVSLAQQVGFDRVVDLAHRAGINEEIRATPALALGAYETTPLEIAGAYTIFATQGEYVRPTFLRAVEDRAGVQMLKPEPGSHHAVLDHRVAFLMRDMLQEVMRSGTGAGVWGRGFSQPAAGKTGTSRDGWFAGFTTGLLCVVWVGFDDNRELDLEGSKSALPIWTEFMKRAMHLGKFAQPFPLPPRGVTSALIDPETGDLADDYCPSRRQEYFVAGSEPRQACTQHNTLALIMTLGQ